MTNSTEPVAARQRVLARVLAIPCVLGALAAFVPDVSALMGTRQTPATVFAGDAEISGVVFLDANASGAEDTGEAGVPGIPIVLMTRWGGRPLGIAETTADGRFQFARVARGTYRLTLQAGEGVTPTSDVSRVVEVTAGSRQLRYDFGIVIDGHR